MVAKNMGEFQVGCQKGRNIRDHTFILHAVTNEAIQMKINIDLNFYDIKQCYDSVWLHQAINDLYKAGVQNRNLNILFSGNSKTRMCVRTSVGDTDRIQLNHVLMQGSVPAGFLCSNQIAKHSNNMYNDGSVYMYMNEVPIPPLAMVDDIVTISQCDSVEGIKMNAQTDTFVKTNKLECQVAKGKCQWVHIGPDTCSSKFIVNNKELERADNYKYLGDEISNSFETLYNKRANKAVGYANTSLAMTTEMSIGFKNYSTFKTLHETIFLNGTLLNMETWPHFSTSRIEMYEKIEQNLLRSVLKAHSKTAIETLYLELGILFPLDSI